MASLIFELCISHTSKKMCARLARKSQFDYCMDVNRKGNERKRRTERNQEQTMPSFMIFALAFPLSFDVMIYIRRQSQRWNHQETKRTHSAKMSIYTMQTYGMSVETCRQQAHFLTYHHRKKEEYLPLRLPFYLYKNLTDSFSFCLLEFREFVPQLLKPFVDLWTRAIKIKPQMNGLMLPRYIYDWLFLRTFFWRKPLFFFGFRSIFPSALMTYTAPVFDHSMRKSVSVRVCCETIFQNQI